MGHWKKAPANVIRTSKMEISKIDKFIIVAYTADKVNIAEKRKPEQNIETLPKGEILKSSFTFIDAVFLNFGGFFLVNKIGTKAIENKREISIKGSYSVGLLIFNNKFPIEMPKKVINM